MNRRKYPPEFRTTGPLRALYTVWNNMKDRCNPDSPRSDRYKKRYADRGITVCDEWTDWPTFARWSLTNGWQRGLEIDRRDNDRGYSPDNCRFVTDMEQTRNRDLELAYRGIREGQTRRWTKPFRCVETGEVFKTQIEAQRRHGVDRKTLRMVLAGKYQQAGGLRWAYICAESL